jgi:hypothetical protein
MVPVPRGKDITNNDRCQLILKIYFNRCIHSRTGKYLLFKNKLMNATILSIMRPVLVPQITILVLTKFL